MGGGEWEVGLNRLITRKLTRQHGCRKQALKICCGAEGRRKTTSTFLKNASRHSLSPRPTTRDASHTGSTKLPYDSYGLMDLSPLFLFWGLLSQGCKGQVCMAGGCQSSHSGHDGAETTFNDRRVAPLAAEQWWV